MNRTGRARTAINSALFFQEMFMGGCRRKHRVMLGVWSEERAILGVYVLEKKGAGERLHLTY